ncbi:isochorismatase family protein [Povalibacter sp.]|uniref:isochorismatase family protein n=1 Tax=Povalibacter sp. TaxID=1962978 RepID=UPI002F40D927
MKSALIVVDVQQSFLHRPYWTDRELPAFLQRLQGLVDRFAASGSPVLQVFHVEEQDGPAGVFSRHSGFVDTLPGLVITPDEVFYKSVHSAMFGSSVQGQSLDYWLRRRGIERLVVTGIRTEQCCETTTRHASDLGYSVTYALDATLTFPMVSESGRTFSADDIRERTGLVLAGRFAEVVKAEAVSP